VKLTAKLAYSQVKTNRSRTLWTLLGIVLSSALITAVCSFAVSGYALVMGLYGEELDNSGGVIAMLAIPVVILSAIIVSMAIIVISNAFRVSAGERKAQFGTLKSIGAAKRQIIETVIYESILLSVVGIPAGIIAGLTLAFAGVQIANHFLGEINSLVHMMMNELIIAIDFVIAWQAIITAVLVSFLTVVFSAWLPARKAAKITAIDSIFGSGEVKVDAKQIRTSRLIPKVFGFEGTLAAKNMKRNKRNFRASVVSLTVGIVLFITLSSISEQVHRIEAMIYPPIEATVLADYTSYRSYVINEVTGKKESVYAAPIDSTFSDIVTKRLQEYGNVKLFGYGFDNETYHALVSPEALSPQMLDALSYPQDQQTYELSVEILTIDTENYALLCEKAGVPVGSTILINCYSYNDNGTEIVFEPFIFEGQVFRLIKADNTIDEIEVQGVLTAKDISNEFLGPNTKTVRLIVPQGIMRGFQWSAAPADVDGFIEYTNAVLDEFFPQEPDSAYMEAGFTTRVYETEDYMKIMNIAIVLATVFVYGFVVLLMLIGLTNVISTMSANVRIRSKEFAVLQSVGMTYTGLKRMLNLESIMCSAKSLVIGLPIAIVLTYLINLPIRSTFPVPYQLPWLAAALCIVAIFAITWVTMRYSISQLRKRNIVETIRSER
jgi:putative ABC transport system permease protein